MNKYTVTYSPYKDTSIPGCGYQMHTPYNLSLNCIGSLYLSYPPNTHRLGNSKPDSANKAVPLQSLILPFRLDATMDMEEMIANN